ncbi:hypothetical protein D3C80_1743630 [compost metagenome]
MYTVHTTLRQIYSRQGCSYTQLYLIRWTAEIFRSKCNLVLYSALYQLSIRVLKYHTNPLCDQADPGYCRIDPANQQLPASNPSACAG